MFGFRELPHSKKLAVIKGLLCAVCIQTGIVILLQPREQPQLKNSANPIKVESSATGFFDEHRSRSVAVDSALKYFLGSQKEIKSSEPIHIAPQNNFEFKGQQALAKRKSESAVDSKFIKIDAKVPSRKMEAEVDQAKSISLPVPFEVAQPNQTNLTGETTPVAKPTPSTRAGWHQREILYKIAARNKERRRNIQHTPTLDEPF